MIKEIITMLSADDWLIGDEDIDIAKGKHSLPTTFREARINSKRWR